MSEVIDVFEVVATDGCVIHRICGPRKLAEQWNRQYGVPSNQVRDASYVRHECPAAAAKTLIDGAVDRFVSWKLPADFHPDGGISFTPDYNQHTPWPAKHEPTGTNLFTVEQARAMFEHCLAQSTLQESRDAAVRLWNDAGEELLATQGALVDLLDAIAGANIPIDLSPARQALIHACTHARRVLAASGEATL